MSIPGGLPAVVGAVAARRRKRLLAKFRQAEAVGRERACRPEDLGLNPRTPLFRVQAARRILVEEEGGRYWLDEAAASRADRLRRWLLLAAVVMALTLLLLAAGS